MKKGKSTDEVRCVLFEAQSSVISFLLNEFLEIKQTIILRRNKVLMNLEGRFPCKIFSGVGIV